MKTLFGKKNINNKFNRNKFFVAVFLVFSILFFTACLSKQYVEGPDKQGGGILSGAALGAGAGALTGTKLGASVGPQGALVGAGFGAIAGSIHGLTRDAVEKDLNALRIDIQDQQRLARAHSVIIDHYQKRLELHPTRDIYPADVFFVGDEVKINKDSEDIVNEVVKLNMYRFPWSRFQIIFYIQSKAINEFERDYATYLGKKRSEAITNYFVKHGINPRRIVTKTDIIPAPILIDPLDKFDRYSQAVEFIPMDN